MKDKAIYIKVSLEEHQTIQERAKLNSLTLSAYLRNLGLGYPVHSTVDKFALNELLRAKGDLGRIGGLFKMWLTNNDKKQATATLGSYNYFSINQLVDGIEEKQEELLQIARKLL